MLRKIQNAFVLVLLRNENSKKYLSTTNKWQIDAIFESNRNYGSNRSVDV